MYVAVYRFSRKYKEIMAGTYSGDLFEETNHALTIEILKGAMERFAFNTPNILKLELSAQVILAFLLDKFVHAVLYDDYQDKDQGFVPSKADKKFLAIFSDNYKQDYANAKTGEEAFDLYLTDHFKKHFFCNRSSHESLLYFFEVHRIDLITQEQQIFS